MKSWPSDYVETNGIKLHYRRTGGNKPPLVLCHGITDNGLCWGRAVLDLEANYDVIMVDARGHGLSDAPGSGYAESDNAADLAGLIDGLELSHPAIMGHSMGAATVAATAALFPGLVACAILEDPPWQADPPAPADHERRDNMRRNWLEQKAKTIPELQEWCRNERPGWDAIELDAWAESKLQFSPHVVEYLGQPRDWRSTVEGIRCPALLIAGDITKGAIVDDRTAREVRSKNPLFEVVTLEGAGHNIRRERFEPYIEAVRDFLSRQFAKA